MNLPPGDTGIKSGLASRPYFKEHYYFRICHLIISTLNRVGHLRTLGIERSNTCRVGFVPTHLSRPCSSVVEQLTVNQRVGGSFPLKAANLDLSHETSPSNICPTNYTSTRIEVTEVNKQYETYWFS